MSLGWSCPRLDICQHLGKNFTALTSPKSGKLRFQDHGESSFQLDKALFAELDDQCFSTQLPAQRSYPPWKSVANNQVNTVKLWFKQSWSCRLGKNPWTVTDPIIWPVKDALDPRQWRESTNRESLRSCQGINGSEIERRGGIQYISDPLSWDGLGLKEEFSVLSVRQGLRWQLLSK